VTLGSLMEEFVIPGFYYLFVQHTKTAQWCWCRWEYLQDARTSCFNCSDWRHKRVSLAHNWLLFLHSR